MKRSSLRRRTPLHRGGRLARRTPLRSVSPKRAKIQRQRWEMVREELTRRELCEAGAAIRLYRHNARNNFEARYPKHASAASGPWSWTRRRQCDGVAVDLHEPLTRARGGSILDPANTVAVCRACHDWIHDFPDAATSIGLLVSS